MIDIKIREKTPKTRSYARDIKGTSFTISKIGYIAPNLVFKLIQYSQAFIKSKLIDIMVLHSYDASSWTNEKKPTW